MEKTSSSQLYGVKSWNRITLLVELLQVYFFSSSVSSEKFLFFISSVSSEEIILPKEMRKLFPLKIPMKKRNSSEDTDEGKK